jgi:hypothetical protein
MSELIKQYGGRYNTLQLIRQYAGTETSEKKKQMEQDMDFWAKAVC